MKLWYIFILWFPELYPVSTWFIVILSLLSDQIDQISISHHVPPITGPRMGWRRNQGDLGDVNFGTSVNLVVSIFSNIGFHEWCIKSEYI